MSEWAPIGSFAKIRRGASPRPIGDPKYFGGNVGWVRIVDVTRSKRYLRQTEQYLSPLGEAHSVRVRPNDLIMSICGTIGRPIIIDMEACIHDGFVQFYDVVGTDLDYFYYVLFHAERDFQGMGQPGTQVNLNTSLVGKKEVFRPALPTQQKIARILQTIDRAMEKTEALIEKYQQIKAGLMHDLFTRGLWTQEELDRGNHQGTPAEATAKPGQLRPTRQDAPHLYQETPIGWIPRAWNLRPCSELCSRICVGIVIQPAKYYVKEGVPAFRSANVREEGIDPSNLVYISQKSNALLAKSQVRSGDIISVRTGYPGTSAVVPDQYDGCNCVDILISTPREEVCSEYLCSWINSDFGKEQVLRQQGGIAQQHFNVGELRQLLVGLPAVEEQTLITKRLATSSARIELEKAVFQKLQLQKAGLMNDLLTGKVPVTPDSEEASVG